MYKPYNRRYIGNKNKLNNWIREELIKTGGDSFLDIFAGTGSVAFHNLNYYKKIGLNDNLFHNFILYNAFFSSEIIDKSKILGFIDKFNNLKYKGNIFSRKYGNKFFTKKDASKIWEARKYVEKNKEILTNREYFILISIIILAADKSSRSVGHFESYLKTGNFKEIIFKELFIDIYSNEFKIYNMDSNILAKEIEYYDVVYVDPPYNSRQYAYFYHVLETIALNNLTDDDSFIGEVSKPLYIYEKTSEYSKALAPKAFNDLIENLNCKYIVVSYNNTFNPKSSSSKNKISFKQIKEILSKKGTLTIKKKTYKFFNSGKTSFSDHKEYLFTVEVNND
ncbi:DNA adenine methylase [Candidatus Mycoplasma mahonii]|uniref:DNA adenine methylase n=1 Tax=Candidatus Mycoplasma mahonii TaxID=3004105 RepID=UPI0026F1E973|nr:DNA adenine methylase [Candidatus Mycoplasma mahonii]WKX02273.1 DNA adenine methylase [Candidatus Mycoplasma mahonii]